MKTWKQNGMAIVAIIALVFAFTACDDGNGKNGPVLCTCPAGTTHEPDETCCNGTNCICSEAEAKTHHSPNTIIFRGTTITTTITTDDLFTDKQWNAIVTAIVDKFSAEYDLASDVAKSAFESAFYYHNDRPYPMIIVEKNPVGYTDYKYVTAPDYYIYVRAGGVGNLNAQTVIVSSINGNNYIDSNPTPTADDFNISGTGTFTYDGNPKAVIVTAKTGKTSGTILVQYRPSANVNVAPSAVGTYTVTFHVYDAPGWNAAQSLPAGTLTIVEQ